jgi:sulfatase maturation enzyme AslB (radical SAM superfamily)
MNASVRLMSCSTLDASALPSLAVIGGKVFLYKGWKEVARRLYEGGATVNMIINAFLFGDDQISQVKYGHLANVGISLDGMEENHNRIRNSRTSFQRVLRAFELLRCEDIPAAVVTSLLDFNLCDLDRVDLLVDNNVKV